jgi:hypothetical protein
LPISEHWAWINLAICWHHLVFDSNLNIQERSSSAKSFLEHPLIPIKKNLTGGLHGPVSLAEMQWTTQ